MRNIKIIIKISLLLFTYILFIGSSFGQTQEGAFTDGINKVENDTLKAFLKKFQTVNYPFEFTDVSEDNVISNKLVKYFFNLDLESDFGFEEFYSNFAFYEEDYIGLIYTRYFTPGAFGINNYFVSLITMDYGGNLIDDEEIGCFCSDTNMGSNDYYASEIEATIIKGKISVIVDNTHATLIVEDEEDFFENITTEEYTITINAGGEISK